MSKNIRKRREKLWIEEGGKCYWCGRMTRMPQRGKPKAIPTPDLATLDHLRTRLDLSRQEPNLHNEERTVLSCWVCNWARGVLDQFSHDSLSWTVNAKVIKDEDIRDNSIPHSSERG